MTQPAQAGGKPALIGCLIVIALIGGGCAALVAFGDSSDSAVDAQTMCEEFVKDRLKSPGTAEFSGETAEPDPADERTYTVTGAVDSQNTFGGVVRNNFTCTVRLRDDGDTWDLKSLTGLTG